VPEHLGKWERSDQREWRGVGFLLGAEAFGLTTGRVVEVRTWAAELLARAEQKDRRRCSRSLILPGWGGSACIRFRAQLNAGTLWTAPSSYGSFCPNPRRTRGNGS